MNVRMKNFVHLVGKTGKEVELVSFESGMQKASVSLATHHYHLNAQGERVEETNWHNLVVWGKTAASFHENVKKGNEIAVAGKLTYRTYTDKNGVNRMITEIVVQDYFLHAKKVSSQGETTETEETEDVELLPF